MYEDVSAVTKVCVPFLAACSMKLTHSKGLEKQPGALLWARLTIVNMLKKISLG